MEENNRKYVHIAVLPETKTRLDLTTPKAYTYDEMLNGLLDIWETKKKAGIISGKSPQNNQTS